MPSASLSANMSTLVRDTYQANGLIRSHQQQHQTLASSQTSLQKLPTSSPQFLYATTQQHQQQGQPQQHMQLPPPPPMAPLVPQGAQQQHVPKNDTTTNNSNNMGNSFNSSLIVPPQSTAQQHPNNNHHHQQMQQQQQQSMNHMAHANMIQQPLTNGGLTGNNSQSTILMSPMMAANNNKNTQQLQQPQYIQSPPNHHQLHPQYQQQQILAPQQLPMSQQQVPFVQMHQQQQQQQQQQQPPVQQQVPMTTIMIPAQAAAQIQSASIQIQQATMQAMANNPSGQPQILVFMIPYVISQPPQQAQAPLTIPPTIPSTPEQASLNSTLVRHSQSNASIIRSSANQQQHQQHPQQQQQQMAHSRAVSSLSNSKQQEPEKFYIKANFSYQATRNKMELSFQKGDILHVLDTLQNSDYGTLQYWLATRVKSNGKDADKGLIPDKNKAEEIALEQRNQDINESGPSGSGVDGTSGVLSASVGRVNFLKRRSAQRSKSLCKDNWDNVVFDIGSFKLPVYERVVFKHPGFCRPVVIFGPLADVAREKLLKDYPEKYSYPTGFHQSSQDHPKVIRLKGILEVVDQGKHALLDITPSAVEKLNYVNLAPIVIFMKTDSKSIIKEFRSRAAKSLDPNARDEDTLRRDGKSSRKLLEQSVKLEKMWYHVFTATLNLSTMGSEMWYRKLRETIENQQSINVWMGERKSDKSKPTSVNNASNSNNLNNTNNTNTNNTNNNNSNTNEMLFQMPSIQSTSSCVLDSSSVLNERFNESLNITSKSTIDLLPDGTYGNRSQLRNAYVHSLAQKLARASSEPKLNGLMSDDHDHEDEDDDRDDNDDDDDIIKKPFPTEYENTSSLSSSNGATSYGHGSMSGSNNMTYQHYPPPPPTQPKPDQMLSNNNNRPQESIYSRNNQLATGSGTSNNINTSYCNGNSSSSNSNYHPLPPMNSTGSGDNNGYHHNQSMNSINNNVIDLSRNHETRGSAFQVYSDMNQNNYHYYNLNKL